MVTMVYLSSSVVFHLSPPIFTYPPLQPATRPRSYPMPMTLTVNRNKKATENYNSEG